jgi:hypothetical protein
MLKAIAGDTVILGLSEENIVRLKKGQPISFDGELIGIKGKRVFIMHGDTELSILNYLQEATNGQAHTLS